MTDQVNPPTLSLPTTSTTNTIAINKDSNQESWLLNQQANGHQTDDGEDEDHGQQQDHDREHPDAPPSKRRKLVDKDEKKHKSSPRAISPPWKSVHADGPTSFLENGKRRSGRTNALPLQLQPQSSKRQTRAAHDKASENRVKPAYNDSKPKPQPKPQARPVPKTKPELPKHAKTPSTDSTIMVRGPSHRSSPRVPVVIPPAKKEASKKTPVKPSPSKDASSSTRRSAPVAARSMKEVIKQKKLELKRERKELEKRRSQYGLDDGDIDELTDDTDTTSESLDLSLPYSGPPPLIKKVSLHVRPPQPLVTTPANIPVPRQYASFEDFIQQDQIDETATRPPWTANQIRKEATKRLKVQLASRRGQSATSKLPPRQEEPAKQYAHHDHLLAHISYFRLLLQKETKEHMRNAQIVAHEAQRYLEAKQAKGRVKSAEEVRKEQTLLWIASYKSVVRDLGKLWQSVEAEVNAARLRQYVQEQQEKIKGHLNRVLERTNDMVLKRNDTDLADSDRSDLDDGDESDNDSDMSDSEDSEQMSVSASGSANSLDGDIDPDATMTTAELKAKYENLPDTEPASAAPTSEPDAEEDSDPETVMDSELDSDEEEDDDAEDEQEDEASDEEDGGGLLSLFSKREIADMAPENDLDEEMADQPITDDDSEPLPGTEKTLVQEPGKDTPPVQPLIKEVADPMDLDQINESTEAPLPSTNSFPHPTHEELNSSRDQSDHTSPGTSITRVTEAESVSSIEQANEQQHQEQEESKSKHMTPVPPLLRGTLREYQHEGLDWLVNLYANGRSGILADEMGLGKTIQSIALLAHLATTYEVWGPHLIVVPTSVMLNWEMEFKKFLPGFKILTYYGDIKERKQKRRGWMADDAFNVVITSYQLVLQDASSFKRRKWHYMILDEAHNIKNFRSERWQTMMTFNTRARLLLTGTPLQNNLTELWSLLFFLHYGQESEGDDDAFAGLREWSEWFKRPVESILEHGKQVLDQEDQEQVAKLHKVIRPFLLRRLKADVEKQMPGKYEHVELCRLSKRQRQLYDGFMSRAQTKETLASGNYLSIINALMQLRKVCNHPDLFETRPINTSFAMPRSVAAEFEITDLLLRRKLFGQDPYDNIDLDFLQLVPISDESMSKLQWIEMSRWNAYQPLKDLKERQWSRVRNRSKTFATADRGEVMTSLENVARQTRLQLIERTNYYDAFKHHQHPIYGVGLCGRLDVPLKSKVLSRCDLHGSKGRFWEREPVLGSINLVQSLETRSLAMQPFIEQYACITPAAVAIDLPVTVMGGSRSNAIRQQQAIPSYDPFHQAQMKLSIAFPDKRLLQYDCGKLQRLDKLLRQLQAGGHRALIFTQMTKVLDILEQFLNIHGHRYLRLDGATKVEQRQILTERFNNDTRILCFILSSRSGGLGINLTGADTVIFYDLDWNPAMDKQCTDRAHRIGQTRDVHIYRFVSEHTIESNILRKANQKQLLDDVVIQEGDFTTDYLNKVTYKDMLDNDTAEDDVAGAAMDRVLGGDVSQGKHKASVLEQAEDRDDVAAARVAEKEVQNADDGDFDDKPVLPTDSISGRKSTLDPYNATNAAIEAVDALNDDGIEHIDDYMLRLLQHLLRDVPLVVRDRDRNRRGKNRKKGGDGRRR
ncbi:swr1 complex component [Lithohypha guttulata]|uniref:DNA helicase n=1 Tax=Lithohypha guttulata TaxID=1690604 RepID=A0AAN7YD03_9EURO|nr:swr1 complex component [Lithohypha guttulata]